MRAAYDYAIATGWCRTDDALVRAEAVLREWDAKSEAACGERLGGR